MDKNEFVYYPNWLYLSYRHETKEYCIEHGIYFPWMKPVGAMWDPLSQSWIDLYDTVHGKRIRDKAISEIDRNTRICEAIKDRLSWTSPKNWDKFVILDTETSGLDDAEVVEIAVTDVFGNVLFNSLIKPTRPIPPEATAIHHITDQMVADAPSYADIHAQLNEILHDKIILAFNSSFDESMIRRTARLYDIEADFQYLCVMRNEMKIRDRERYISLLSSVGAYKQEHRALTDCLMIAELINRRKELWKLYKIHASEVNKYRKWLT